MKKNKKKKYVFEKKNFQKDFFGKKIFEKPLFGKLFFGKKKKFMYTRKLRMSRCLFPVIISYIH